MANPNEPIGDVPDDPERERAEREKQKTEGDRAKPGHSTLAWFVFGLLVVVVGVLAILLGWLPRHKRQQEIDEQSKQRTQELPRVNVQTVRYAPSTSELMIPGTTMAYTEAYIYARASGYVSRRLVDIGDRVRAGQLLATIDAPDLDKQVAQARSALQQSESNLAQMEAQLRLASVTWDRYKVLVAKGVFSRQDGDQQEANYRVAQANVAAAQNTVQGNRENLDRLILLQGYEQVRAPFSGVITARNIDVGSLITAQGSGLGVSSSPVTPGTTQSGIQGNNEGASGNVSSGASPSTGGAQGGEMFGMADTGRLRILVSVPEAYSPNIHIGERAVLFFEEIPDQKFEGRVTRTSASIDQNTRTLLVEVQVRNESRRLLPGMYAVVNFVDVKPQPALMVPGEAIVVRNAKTSVALVENNVVHFRPISIGRDYGDETEVVSGLKAGDVIAMVVSDEIQDGAKINPQYQNEPQQAGGQSDQRPGDEGQYGNQDLSSSGGKAAKKQGGKKNAGQKNNSTRPRQQ